MRGDLDQAQSVPWRPAAADEVLDDWLEFSNASGDRALRVFAHLSRHASEACGEWMRSAALLGLCQLKLLTTGELDAAAITRALGAPLQALRDLHGTWLSEAESG